MEIPTPKKYKTETVDYVGIAHVNLESAISEQTLVVQLFIKRFNLTYWFRDFLQFTSNKRSLQHFTKDDFTLYLRARTCVSIQATLTKLSANRLHRYWCLIIISITFIWFKHIFIRKYLQIQG